MATVDCLFALLIPESVVRRGSKPRAFCIALTVTLLATLTACGSDAPAEATACGAFVIENLDPLSVQHVLPGADVTYLTSPPTSGPHVGGAAPSGALDEPLDETVQVSVLEGGRTLVQYQPTLPASEIDELRSLGGLRIVVAPNPELAAPVIATRWRAKLTCARASAAELEAFSLNPDLPATEAD